MASIQVVHGGTPFDVMPLRDITRVSTTLLLDATGKMRVSLITIVPEPFQDSEAFAHSCANLLLGFARVIIGAPFSETARRAQYKFKADSVGMGFPMSIKTENGLVVTDFYAFVPPLGWGEDETACRNYLKLALDGIKALLCHIASAA